MSEDVYMIQESGAECLLENISLQSASPNGLVRLNADCILQSADTPNLNKRVYSHAICENFVQSAKEKMRANNGLLLGECNHPDLGSNESSQSALKRQLSVYYDRCCVGINNIDMRGNLIESNIKFLSNDMGQNMAKMVYYDGIVPGMSCRALGKTRPSSRYGKSITEVYSPCILVTWDMVESPSHSEARMTKVTEAIKNPKGLMESANAGNVVLDESSTVLSLRDIFLNDTSNSIEFLIESLLHDDSKLYKDENSMSEKSQKLFVQSAMTNVLNEYISTTPDVKDAKSTVKVLNESNITEMLHDYSHNQDKYSNIKKTRESIRKFLNI